MTNRLKAIWFLTLIPPSLFFYGLGSGNKYAIMYGALPAMVAGIVFLGRALAGAFDE